jgi:serine protease inhibitor
MFLIISQALVRGQVGNVLVSPVSVSILLAMLQQGSLGRSADQLNAVLHVLPGRAREGYGHIVRSLKVTYYVITEHRAWHGLS